MPRKYERIRDSMMEQGMSAPEAKKRAAMTYNKQRKRGEKPVTRKGHKG